ncbi:MAG: hypothetical protein VW547_02350 [Alphaproteobacteria bacterium]
MTGAISLAIVLAAAAGFGAWLPVRFLGGRLFAGALATTALMNGIHFTLAVPLFWTGLAVMALALPGLLRIAISAPRTTGGAAPRILAHPAVVLPVVAGIVMLARGFDSYSLYSWDEFASWVYWPREAFALDTYFADGMNWQSLLYTQGWPMAVLFPQTPFAQFEPVRGAAVAVVWHAALLGLFYDALNAHVRRALPALPTTTRALLGWLVVLTLLALESTWTLMPQLLLIEKPQIYMIAASLAFLLLALATDDGDAERNRCVLGAGIALAGAYLVKVTALGAVLPTALAVLLIPAARRATGGFDWRGAGRRLALLLAPVATVYVWWSVFRPYDAPPGCLADPFALTVSGGDAARRAADAAGRLAAAAGAYVLAYKLPLSLIGLAGLAVAVFDRRLAPVAWAIAAYATIYFLSLIPLYVWCYGSGYELQKLDSLQRYLRVPLRILHLLGPGLLFLAVLRALGRAGPPALIRPLAGRTFLVAATVLVAAAGTYQVFAIDAAIGNAAVRDREPAETVATIDAVERDADRLIGLTGTLEFDAPPKVTMIAQGQVGFELRIARYRALSERRGRRFHYRIESAYSWGPKAANQWMHAISAERLAAHFRDRDILWPIETNAWVRGVIGRLVADNACAGAPESYFLVRSRGGDADFRCVPKEG